MKAHTMLLLGPSGSGKTTFLASFFKQLSLPDQYSFFLKHEDPEKRKRLVKLYERLANNGEWPAGTRQTSLWRFDCCIKTPDLGHISACDLKLFDYKGGIITATDQISDEQMDDEQEFYELAKRPDAILAILDGQKVLSFMQDKNLMTKEVTTWIEQDLSNILQMIVEYDKHVPVHFLISKWDVLEEANYQLSDVKQHLVKTIPSFYALIKQRHRAKCPVYLIPASAIGQGFATLRNGRMEKNPGSIPRPALVEVPLALSLIDRHYQPQRKLNFLSCILLGFASLFLLYYLPLIWLILVVYLLFRLVCKRRKQRIRHHGFSKGSSKSSSKGSSKDSSKGSSKDSSDEAFRLLLGECRQIRQDFLAQFPEAICRE